jgi:cytoskeletal protein CcmA (bactofilin family)
LRNERDVRQEPEPSAVKGSMMKKNHDQINAFLGKDTEFEGKLSFTGAVRMDCRFKGEILSGGTLIVGESAVIESDVHVSQIVVSGEVRGNIVADRVEIRAPGKVIGNIRSPVLVIEEGVLFDGSCQMHVRQEIAGNDFSVKDLAENKN